MKPQSIRTVAYPMTSPHIPLDIVAYKPPPEVILIQALWLGLLLVALTWLLGRHKPLTGD